MDMVYDSIYKTETASKLVREFNETKPGMFQDMGMMVGKLMSEISYAQSANIGFSKKIDLLIQQESMSGVIMDVFKVLQTPLQNDTTLIEKTMTLEDSLDILAGKT